MINIEQCIIDCTDSVVDDSEVGWCWCFVHDHLTGKAYINIYTSNSLLNIKMEIVKAIHVVSIIKTRPRHIFIGREMQNQYEFMSLYPQSPKGNVIANEIVTRSSASGCFCTYIPSIRLHWPIWIARRLQWYLLDKTVDRMWKDLTNNCVKNELPMWCPRM